MSDCFRTTRRVEFRDTDAAAIAHFSTFFVMMEEVEHEFLRSLGLSVLMSDDQGPLSWPRVAAKCDYAGAARFEDVLDAELTIERLGEKSVAYRVHFSRAGQPIAEGTITAVCCRLENSHWRGVPIPEAIRRKLEPFKAS